MSVAGFLEKLLDRAEVAWVPLGELTTVKTGQSVNKNLISTNPGPYPVINSGREPLGFIDKWNTDDDPVGVTTRGAGVGSITWQEGKYYRGNLNYAVSVRPNVSLAVRFLYHLLLEMQSEIHSLCTFDGIPALNAGKLKELSIPIPCPDDPEKSLAIQGEIVRILDTFTELTAELNQRKKQYIHYRDQLLTFDEDKVEWKMLGDVARIKTGQSVNKKMIAENPGQFPVINSGREPLGFLDDWNTQDDPIGITSRGAGVGSVTWQEGSYFRGNLNYSVTIRSHDTLDVHYLYHVLEKYQPQIKELCTFDGIPALNAVNLKKLSIPVPSLVEQKRIAAVLDTFDTLTTSLTEGLPREIALREKQYTWYRDQLLSFPKPDAEAA